MLNRKVAFLTVVVSGLAVTALELAAARLIAPFFGSTIFVYGSAIGVVLAALALGYWLGGRLADRYPSRNLLASCILVAGASAGIVPLVFRPVAGALDAFGRGQGIPVGILVVVCLTVLFLLPILALGAVSPFVLRLSLRGVDESGRWSGLLSGASTGGSIVGTFLATFVTIPLLGTRQTILGAAGLLLLLGLGLGRFRSTTRGLLLVLFVMATVAGTNGVLLPRPGLIWERESPYQLVQVWRSGDTSYLVTDAAQGTQSVYRRSTPYTGTIYDAFLLLPFLAQGQGQRRSVLVLGLAGGSMVRLYEQVLEKEFDFNVTGVEIDERIIEAARTHFALDSLSIEVIHDDARRFLRQDDQRYDLIIVDAYVHELQIPPLLATREFFSLVRDRLAEGGVVGMNVVALKGNRFYPKFLQTVTAVFPDVREAPFISGAVNHFVLAAEALDLNRLPASISPETDRFIQETVPSLQPVVRSGGPIYTDNQTDIEFRVASLQP